MLKKIIVILLIVAVSSCAHGKITKKNKDCYDEFYRLTEEYNKVIEQDEKCAEELGKCIDQIETNSDYIKDLKKKQRKENMKWMGIGLGVSGGFFAIIMTILLLTPK